MRKITDRAAELARTKTRKAVEAAKFSLIQVRELLRVLLPALVLAVGAFIITLRFVEPPPPTRIQIATGPQGGAFHAFGKRYASALAKAGITLDVVETAGSVENLRLLNDPARQIDGALLQGGLLSGEAAGGLVSVGRVMLEPVWVFYRAPGDWTVMRDLIGKRVAIGPPGSGTRALAGSLVGASGLGETEVAASPLSGIPAAEALERGEIDAVVLVSAPEAQAVQRLLKTRGVKLMSFAQADALMRRFPFLTRVTLPRGAIDLRADEPAADITLVAAATALVVHERLHPAVVTLLAEAAQDIHSRPGLFHAARQFPATPDPEIETSPVAERHYKQGQSFLRRSLPFWLASFVERMTVLLIPILTIVLPAMKIVPALYRWQIKQRLNHYYGRLKDLEAQVAVTGATQDRIALADELDAIDRAVTAVPVPIAYAEQLYNLRAHIDLVRGRLAATARGELNEPVAMT